MIPTAPLSARNRLASIVLGALADAGARRRLEALAADPAEMATWLERGQAGAAAHLSERARAAAAAVRSLPLGHPAGSEPLALAAARALFDAGLGFETHEVLEPHWAAAAGGRRETLQGLIQVAVGFQHLANGNRAGARALIAEGAGRLHGRSLDALELDGFARAAAAAAVRIEAGEAPPPPPFPR